MNAVRALQYKIFERPRKLLKRLYPYRAEMQSFRLIVAGDIDLRFILIVAWSIKLLQVINSYFNHVRNIKYARITNLLRGFLDSTARSYPQQSK